MKDLFKISSQDNLINSRNQNIDILKSIAIIGVLFIHVSAGGLVEYQKFSFDYFVILFYGTIIRFSVPVFFMCSGALLLNPQKNISLKVLFKKYLLRIIIALFFWAFAYQFIYFLSNSISSKNFDFNAFIQIFKNLILFKHHFHLYFLQIMIIVYAFLPFTRLLVKNMSSSEVLYLLILWFALGICYPFFKQFYPFSLLSGIPTQYSINMTYSAIGYGILGYYLSLKQFTSAFKCFLAFCLGFITTFAGMALFPELKYSFWQGFSPAVALMSASIFAFVSAFMKNKKCYKVFTNLSKASFSIFLVHDFFNILLFKFGISFKSFSPVLSVPLIVCFELIASYLIYICLSKIPKINKYLI